MPDHLQDFRGDSRVLFLSAFDLHIQFGSATDDAQYLVEFRNRFAVELPTEPTTGIE